MKVLFLVGPHASGKTYSTKLALQQKEFQGIEIIDTGPIIREIHQKSAPDKKIGEWVRELEEQYGEFITDEIIANEIKKRTVDKEKVIIIGYRTIQGIAYLIKKNEMEDYQITYIDAPISLLHKNYMTRTKKEIDLETFQKYIKEELETGLGELKTICTEENSQFQYFYKESNEQGLENIFEEFFKPPKVYQKRINIKGEDDE